jgi:membrane dipeptidase
VSEERVPRPRLFDAHCDTILKVVERGADFEGGGAPGGGAAGGVTPGVESASSGLRSPSALHVTLPGMLQAGVCAQVFAVCVVADRHKGREDEAAMKMVEAVGELCQSHPEELVLAGTWDDIQAACAGSGRIAAIPSLEGADPLKGDLYALAGFHQAGVRLLTLAWADNPFCGSAMGSGSGLTQKGQDLVGYCDDLGVLVDVSHASDAAFWEVCSIATKPFVASHSNCRSLCPSPRNLTDDMIRALAERGGVVGVNLYSGFLSSKFHVAQEEPNGAIMEALRAGKMTRDEAGAAASALLAGIPRPPLSLLPDHVKHLIDVGGEDCVGLGGDLDGIDSAPTGMDGVADYPKIVDLLADAGLSPAQVEKICHRNFARVFREVMA